MMVGVVGMVSLGWVCAAAVTVRSSLLVAGAARSLSHTNQTHTRAPTSKQHTLPLRTPSPPSPPCFGG